MAKLEASNISSDVTRLCAHFLQDVASLLGYQGLGLARLSSAVLGCQLPKSKSVSRSNWAAPHLTNFQLKYAAL